LIELGAPHATVLPVLTKCDQLLAKGADVTMAALEAVTSEHIAWLLEAIDTHQAKAAAATRGDGGRLRIDRNISIVSSITGGDTSLENLRVRIEGMLLRDEPIFPSIGQAMPRVTALTTVFIRALRDGRDFVDSARAADLGYLPSGMSTEQKQVRWHMGYDEMHRLYYDEFVPALKLPVASDQVRAPPPPQNMNMTHARTQPHVSSRLFSSHPVPLI
jgi:hypothetical protein